MIVRTESQFHVVFHAFQGTKIHLAQNTGNANNTNNNAKHNTTNNNGVECVQVRYSLEFLVQAQEIHSSVNLVL